MQVDIVTERTQSMVARFNEGDALQRVNLTSNPWEAKDLRDWGHHRSGSAYGSAQRGTENPSPYDTDSWSLQSALPWYIATIHNRMLDTHQSTSWSKL